MSDQIAREPTYRVPHRGGMDPATKRLALIAAGLGGALLVVLGAWSTLGGHSGPVPVISAPTGPVRVKPENPGGLKVANDLILSGGLNDAAGDKLAPAPETPDPQGLKAPPAPPPVAAAATPAPVARTAPPPLAAAPAQTAAPAHPAVAARTEPKPAPSPAAASGHGVQVQLAALPTREGAEAEWRLLSSREHGLLGKKTPSFSQVDIKGRTWWRLRTGGFADEAEARAFCEKLHTACSVARF